MIAQIKSVVDDCANLSMQLNAGERQRIMHRRIGRGSLWITPRSSDYIVCPTGEAESELYDFLREQCGHQAGEWQSKKYWHIEQLQEVEKIIRRFDGNSGLAANELVVKAPARRNTQAPKPNQQSLCSPDDPDALGDEAERERRKKLLSEPHMTSLVQFLHSLREENPRKELPFFDPCDGGVEAKVLFLFEAPGPKAVGSTFISRNNPDPTARNACQLLNEAGISRQDTLLWNIVPWFVGDGGSIRPVENDEITESLPYLKLMLTLLPQLKLIVLSGKKTQSARGQIRNITTLPILQMPHPSARLLNPRPEKRQEIKEILSCVAQYLKALE